MGSPRTQPGERDAPLTVGQVAERYGITVRTLHHYDEIGLLTPGQRSPAGYRGYTRADLTRLQHVVVYRRLGFGLEQIKGLLDDPEVDVAEHLRRQRAAVESRIDELRDLVTALDHALEVRMSDHELTEQDRRDLFGEDFSDVQEEAERRWGDTDAWRESQRRTADYGKQDWQRIRDEQDGVDAAYAVAKRSGQPADSSAAMDAAERHRAHICRRFYDCSTQMHRGLADMYLADPRFRQHYEDLEPDLAEYVRNAVHANADRQDAGGPS